MLKGRGIRKVGNQWLRGEEHEFGARPSRVERVFPSFTGRAVWPQASRVASLSLDLLVGKMRIMTAPASHGCCGAYMPAGNVPGTGPGNQYAFSYGKV